MGGDQVYADKIFQQDIFPELELLQTWLASDVRDRMTMQSNPQFEDDLRLAYLSIYKNAWGSNIVRQTLATIPSAMMWDDHDIFDGWGSLDNGWCNSPIGQAIFKVAREMFCLLQLREANLNQALIATPTDYSWYLKLNNIDIVAMDQRSQRTITQIMSSSQWQNIQNQLHTCNHVNRILYVMIAVPPIYQRFYERFEHHAARLDSSPAEGVIDDLRDHWNNLAHQTERNKLFYTLDRLTNPHKIVILSGDVHVGGFGVLEGQRKTIQVIASGIQSAPPTFLEWEVIRLGSTCDPLIINQAGQTTLTAQILPIPAANANEYLRSLHYAWLQEGTDQLLWINWVAEDQIQRYVGV